MSQHDETKRMLGLIRESNNSKKNKSFLFEEINVVSDKDLGEEDPNALKEEKRKFRDTVTPRVEFNKFKLYPKSQNVEFSGRFTSNNIEWYYSLDDTDGVYITGDLIQLNGSTLEQIQKLVAYYENWSDEWATKIAEEYKDRDSENNDEESEDNFGEEL